VSLGYLHGVSESAGLKTLRRHTRFTLLASIPFVGLLPVLFAVANGVRLVPMAVLVVGVAVLLVTHWRRMTRIIADPSRALPWRRSVVTFVLSVGLLVYAFTYADPGNALWAYLPAVVIVELQSGRPAAVGWRINASLTVGVTALVVGLTVVVPVDTDPVGAAIATLIALFALSFGEVFALRQWRIALELDQARRDAAELGATRERLRFAEDLHDILGHALEVVSLKSELATRLAPVDLDRAMREMADVQRLARGAVKDVRDLARGRRPTTLDTELTGACTLLASAGIACVVDGTPAGPHSELFGRVLREAVTNLLRHADTRQCWITVRPATLTVVNDGVDHSRLMGDGTGLVGLRRRVTEAGGELTAGPGERPGTFAVAVVL
jgi:two-component system, NarL family, sensor histidine kinase DesK